MSIGRDNGFKKDILDTTEKYGDEFGEFGEDEKLRLAHLVKGGLDYAKHDLNMRQVLFAVHYVFDTACNAKAAALQAGYPDSVANIASTWVNGKNARPKLQDFISELTASFGVTKTQILAFLKQVMVSDFWDMAMSIRENPDDPTDFIAYFDWKRLKETGYTKLIKDVSWHNGEIKSVTIHDPMKAAELLGQSHAMFKKSVEIRSINDALADAEITAEESQIFIEEAKRQYKEQVRAKRQAEAEARLKKQAVS